jgi:hypothetical protein
MRRVIQGLIGILALASMTGCSSFYSLEFVYESGPPDNAVVSFDEIRIHEGIVVGVTARPLEDAELMDSETVVRLVTDDPTVLGVAQAFDPEYDSDDEDEANWSFVVYGAKAGSTSLFFYIDDDLQGEIPAVVDPQ